MADKFNPDAHINPTFHDVAVSKALKGSELRDAFFEILADNGYAVPQADRVSDTRLIINNISGHEITFVNPGNNSHELQHIPVAGDDGTAVMVMVKGATPAEQYKNAQTIYDRYQLATKGLTPEFAADITALATALKTGVGLDKCALAGLLDQAYGPAPFAAQSGKLVDVIWTGVDGTKTDFAPHVATGAAFGMRPSTKETVILAQRPALSVEGDGTVAEIGDAGGINIAIDADGRTRPITTDVAQALYGNQYDDVKAIIGDDNKVKAIVLQNEGNKVLVDRHPNVQSYKPLKP